MEARESLKIGPVARRLGVCRNTAKALIRRGELPGYRVGRDHHVDLVDLETYIAEQKNAANYPTARAVDHDLAEREEGG